MSVRDRAEAKALEAVAIVCVEAEKADAIVRAAVGWFDQHRPKWGPGTLPAWYADAREYLRTENGQ